MSNQGKNRSHQQPTPQQLPQETINQFLENQSRQLSNQAAELDYKKQELRIREKEQQFAFEYSKQALAAQERSQENQAKHQRKLLSFGLLFFGAVLVLFLGFLLFMVLWDKEEFATQFLERVVVPLITGLIGFYAGRKSQSGKPAPPSQDEFTEYEEEK